MGQVPGRGALGRDQFQLRPQVAEQIDACAGERVSLCHDETLPERYDGSSVVFMTAHPKDQRAEVDHLFHES